jgi:phage shock protein PspC (stress-responsive transcriptional regulator)
VSTRRSIPKAYLPIESCDNDRDVAAASDNVLRRGSDRVISGVCSGLAGYFAIDVWLVRLTFIALLFLGGLGLLAYIVLYAVMAPPLPGGGVRAGEPPEAIPASPSSNPSLETPRHRQWGDGFDVWYNRGRNGAALGLMVAVIGFFFLLSNLGWLNWWRWDLFWPIVLIAVGLLIVVRRLR